MAVIVQKFGGTSVGSIDRIKQVSSLIKAEIDNGNKVVVVASAMAGVTDQLISLSSQVSNLETEEQRREHDAIVSAGEKISCGVLALHLHTLGINARSWQGWQLPIITDKSFTKGKIKSIASEKLAQAFDNNEVPIITGFQGVNDNRLVTLGRGGSDTSAVALAAALKADRCDIYTDVDGVYTADPRIVLSAKKLSYVTFDEMLELASSGCKVVHARAVEIAAKFGIALRILSSFSAGSGTDIVKSEGDMEGHKITGVTADKNLSCWELEATQSQIIEICDMMNEYSISLTQLSLINNRAILILPLFERERFRNMIDRSGQKAEEKADLALVSIVGIGIKAESEVLQKAFKILTNKAINIVATATSGISINFLVPKNQSDLAVSCLHDDLLLTWRDK